MDERSRGLDGLTPEEASRIIHSHRKVRYGTACWPCRQRKVKCDNKQPCENCVKRDHARLCLYKPNRSSGVAAAATSKHGSTASSGPSSALTGTPAKRPRSPDRSEGQQMDTEPPSAVQRASAASPGVAVDADVNEMSRYLGQNSIPALLRDQVSPSREEGGVEYIRKDMRSILGLDNSAPFPLMSSRHLDRLTVDIAAELPSDREVMKLFYAYKEIPHPFWGFVLDIHDLETRLMVYLEDRAQNAKKGAPRPAKPVSASWLAILLAVLAVGSQYHDSPYHVRTRDAQKYIQISFHFLRVGNFMLRPNFDSIQALMMTCFVLLNDMKAEASWALLGLTTRLAQSLGLDRAPLTSDGRASPDLQKKDHLRRTLWWTIVWHDCLTSLSFDRSPMTSRTACPIPRDPLAVDGWQYLEAMYHLCQFIGTHLSPEVTARTSYAQILQNCEDVESIRTKVIPQLRSKDACRSAMNRLHHYAIRLHTAFVVSVCCRPALRRSDTSDATMTAEQKQFLADKCKANLTETVRMFLAMHQLSVIPTRSWAFTYHGLSSAVLLGILGTTQADPEVRSLQGDLIHALSATAAKEKTTASPPAYIARTDRDIELSGPLSRALLALKNIYDHGNISGHVKKTAPSDGSGPVTLSQSGSQVGSGIDGGLMNGGGNGADNGNVTLSTTLAAPILLASGPGVGGGVDSPAGVLSLDPHQDAALAMAEMQNGTVDLRMMSTLPVQQATGGLPDLSNIDMSTYLSPMDLYDQIFWENPEPWNLGADAMNFDFVAQPPPGQAQQQSYS